MGYANERMIVEEERLAREKKETDFALDEAKEELTEITVRSSLRRNNFSVLMET